MRLMGVVGLLIVGCGPAFTARQDLAVVESDGAAPWLLVEGGPEAASAVDGDPGNPADAGPTSSQDAFSDPEGGVGASDASEGSADAGIESGPPVWDGRVCGSQGAPCITPADCCSPFVCGSDQVCNPS